MNPYKLQSQNGMPGGGGFSMGMASMGMMGGPAGSMPLMGGAGGNSMGNPLGSQPLYPSFSQMQQMQQHMPFQHMPPGPNPTGGPQHMSSSGSNAVGGGAGVGSGPLSSNMGMPPYPGMSMSTAGPSPYSDPTQYNPPSSYPRYPGSYPPNPAGASSMTSSGPPAMPLMSGPPPPPLQSPLGMSPSPMHPHAGMGGNPMAAAMGGGAGGGSGLGPGAMGPPGMGGPGGGFSSGAAGMPDQSQPLPAPAARKRPLTEELGPDGLATKAQKSEIGQIMQRLDTMAAQQTQQLNQRMESFEQRMEQKIGGLEQKMEGLTAMVQAACHNSQARAFNSRGQGRASDPLKPLQVESGPKAGTAPPSTGSNRQRNHYGAQFPATVGEAQKLDSLHLAALSEFYGVPFPDYGAFAYFIGCA